MGTRGNMIAGDRNRTAPSVAICVAITRPAPGARAVVVLASFQDPPHRGSSCN